MNGEMKHVAGRKNWTYASEESEWHTDHSDTTAARMKPFKAEMLSIIKTRVNREFNALQDYLSGKIKKPEIVTVINEIEYPESLLFFENPEIFEEEVSALDDDLGELSETDLAWIKNTRELIRKYHVLVYENKETKNRRTA